MTADRKKEAREKFLLGGIVVRAGLLNANRAFLLGGLLEMTRIVPGTAEHRRLCDIGELAFRAAASNGGFEVFAEAAE
jgi:hypothetical protein